MARGDDIKKILYLAKDMRDSTLGYSIQMIQDELEVSRRTAMRIKNIISDVFEVEEVLNKLSGKIDEETMINLNYQVDEEGKTPEEVAHNFLVEENLISK